MNSERATDDSPFARAWCAKLWHVMRLPELRCAICGAHCLDQTTRIIAKGETDQTCLCATCEVTE